MKSSNDFYNYQRIFRTVQKKIEAMPLAKKVREFNEYLKAQGVSFGRLAK